MRTEGVLLWTIGQNLELQAIKLEQWTRSKRIHQMHLFCSRYGDSFWTMISTWLQNKKEKKRDKPSKSKSLGVIGSSTRIAQEKSSFLSNDPNSPGTIQGNIVTLSLPLSMVDRYMVLILPPKWIWDPKMEVNWVHQQETFSKRIKMTSFSWQEM